MDLLHDLVGNLVGRYDHVLFIWEILIFFRGDVRHRALIDGVFENIFIGEYCRTGRGMMAGLGIYRGHSNWVWGLVCRKACM